MQSKENTEKQIEFLTDFVTAERLDKINNIIEKRTKYLTVVLEDIYHPHNASAVIRTCECFGIQDMYTIENVKQHRVNKCVTQGAGKWVTLNRYANAANNTENCVRHLKKKGYKIVATSLREGVSVPPEELPVDNKLALCFGTEELGLSDTLHDMADYFVKIPMVGFTQSFNISVSAALILQVLTGKLRNSDIGWKLNCKEKQDIRLNWIKNSIRNVDAILKRIERC
ncbi:MAG TPA: RNA methyltransferase [Victivallales bacterium]|nr:RNA methyltransferase [Victivallales bacterium]